MPDNNTIQYTQYGVDVGSLLTYLYNFITGSGTTVEELAQQFWDIWQIIALISFALSGFFLFAIIYSKFKLHELEEHLHHTLHEAEEAWAHNASKSSENKRWQDAVTHIESENPNDWRLAIIEADIMLEELLNSLGYAGLTIGDKLKKASPQFFKSIDEAWSAHKVRNQIAHKGTDFVLTKRIAKDTIEKYRRVFEEHSII